MKTSLLTLAVALQTAGNPAAVSGGHRGKRIIWGTPLINYNSYGIIGYYAYIANGAWFSWNLKNLWALSIPGGIPQPIPSSLACGGSLLTTTIVYTACHCVADYVSVNATYSRGELKSFWELSLTVFVGWTMVGEIVAKEGAWVKFAVPHQNCAQVGSAPVFDFGLIVLKTFVRLKLSHMAQAPVQTNQGILKEYVNAVSKERVCLYVGFGYYYYYDRQKGIPGEESPVLQHGWRVFTNLYACLATGSYYFNPKQYPPGDYVTWLCSIFFGRERASIMRGDSGSPVACNERRVGLASFRSGYPANLYRSRDYIAAIAFDLVANAAEFRQSLEDYLEGYSKGLSDWRPTVFYTVLPSGYTAGKVNPILFEKNHSSLLRSKVSTIWTVIMALFCLPFLL